MISLRSDQIGSILCIGAHSDDIEIGCGGTILKLLRQRPDIDIRWVVLSADETRAAEAHEAANRFLEGVSSSRVDVMSFSDAHFPYTDAAALKCFFGELSREVRPDLIFTHRREDQHQDHRFVAELTWQHFRNHLILEYEIPKYEGDLGQPSLFVPLTAEIAEAKIDLITLSFASQHDKPWFDTATLQAMLRIRGIECQSPSGLAEAFHCRKLVLG